MRNLRKTVQIPAHKTQKKRPRARGVLAFQIIFMNCQTTFQHKNLFEQFFVLNKNFIFRLSSISTAIIKNRVLMVFIQNKQKNLISPKANEIFFLSDLDRRKS